MNAKTIVLEKPVSLFGKQISEVRVTEPTGLQYIQLGDPRMPVSLGDGGGYWIEQPKIIEAYCDKIIEYGDGREKNGGALLALLSLDYAKQIKAALFGFFLPASERRIE